MDTERWQILLKAIDRGSLRAAAEEMGFTVSGISRSVATLEKELGFALHDQTRLYCIPSVSTFIGGDIVSGVLASSQGARRRLRHHCHRYGV